MKKLGIICLTLVVALGLMGVGYAQWQQTLTVTGSVSTGTFDTQFQNVSFVRDTNNVANGNVASVLAHSFTVNVTDLYPGCEESARFDVANTGSVPAKVNVFKITFTPAGGSSTDYAPLPVSLNLSNPLNSTNDIKVSVTGIALNDTIGVGAANAKTDCLLTIRGWKNGVEDNDCDQSVSGTFTFTIGTIQQY
jgi:hypothetical protein